MATGLATDDRGASSVEYGLVVVAIAAVVVAVVVGLGTVTKGNFTSTCQNWDVAAGLTNQC